MPITKKSLCKYSTTCAPENYNHHDDDTIGIHTSTKKKNKEQNNRHGRVEEKPEYKCFGMPYSVPAVCSGSGICKAQDVCDCTSPYVGLACDVDPSNIQRSWFSLELKSSVLFLGSQTSLQSWVDVSNAAQGKFPSLLYRFGLYNSSGGIIAERLSSNVSSWNVGTSMLGIGNYVVNTTVSETRYNTAVFSNRLEFMILDLNNLNGDNLKKFSTRNLKDILENMGKNKTEIRNIVKEISGRSFGSINEAKDASTSYLIGSQDNKIFNDEELALLIGSGTFNLTTTVLERVKMNEYNESILVEGLVTDFFNISSNLLAIQVLSNSSKHATNIQETIFGGTSALALIRSDRSLVRISLDLFEVVVTNQTSFNYGVSVSVPSSVTTIGKDVTFGVVSYGFGVGFTTENNTNPNITSISNVMNFRTMVAGDYFPLNGLVEPLQFVFNTQNVENVKIASFNESLYSKNISCRYWNTSINSWDSYGCSATLLSNNQVQCRCDHTTSFSAFVEYIPIAKLANPGANTRALTSVEGGLMTVKIVISSIFLVVISIVMIGLVIFRNSQPVKSRYYFPYLGLSSLFVWLAFSIGSNGTTLGFLTEPITKNSSPVIVNNVQVVITSSLVSISVCSYLFACIRYMFYRYYYEWMTFTITKNKGKVGRQWVHILKSNGVVFGGLATIGTIICLYFVLLVVLRATEVFDARQYSLAGSISHFLIMISLMACIISVFIVDLYLDFRSKQISDEMHDLSQEISSMESETTGGNESPSKNQVHKLKNLFGKNTTPSKIYHYWFTNDRLLFRVDAIIYTLGMLFFIAAYIVGFRTLDLRYNYGLSEAQAYQILTLDSLSYAFEILMICCFIAVYGGTSFISSLHSKYATGQSKIMQTRIRNSKTEFSEIYSLIQSNHLLKLFKGFCKSEFSLENLSLWLRVFQAKKYQEDWVNLASEDAKKSWTDFKNEIGEWKFLYIANGSPMSVNISARTRNSFEYWCNQTEISDYDAIDKKELSSMLESLETELIYNLLDTYSRFHISEPFKIIKSCTEGREELSGGIFKSL